MTTTSVIPPPRPLTQGEVLLKAVIADPADDLVRMAYADWLEKTGDDARAEFIRVQIELATMEGGYPTLSRGPRAAQLVSREKALRHVMYEFGGGVTFTRGFIQSVRCPLASWIQHGAAIAAAHPVKTVDAVDREPFVVLGHDWSWVEDDEFEFSEVEGSHFILKQIWDTLEGYDTSPTARIYARRYPTREAALAALSAALIRWARR